jgi:branched-chain amino acid transport system substrate-binding protein
MSLGTRRALLTAAAVAALGAASCGGEKTAQFGAVLPLSGNAQVYGQAIQRGIDLAMKKVQTMEGLPVQQVTMVTADSASNPEQAAQKLREIFAGNAIAAIGGVTSAEAIAMVPIANEADRVMLSPSASSQELSGISRNFYRIFPSAEAEAVALANHTVNTLEVQTLLILADSTAFGQGLAQNFQANYERAGGKVVETLSFEPDTTDLTSLAQRARELERQVPGGGAEGSKFAVFVAAAGDDLANALRTLRREGYKSRILASSALASEDVLKAAGEAAEFVYFAQTPFDPSDEIEPMTSFVTEYQAEYGEPPSFYAAHGYDAVLVLVQALREADSANAIDFRNGMRAIANFPGVTGSIQFRENGDVQRFMRVHLVSQGKPRDFEEYMSVRRQEIIEQQKRLEQQRRELERRLQQGTGSS